jgi:signal transduction histidine kinase/ActR/RegA family two-component response regulator
MIERAPVEMEQRVLLRLATAKDAELTAAVLSDARIQMRLCSDLPQVLDAWTEGAGAIVIAEEALGEPGIGPLEQKLLAQEPWSDLPVIVLARAGPDSNAVARTMGVLPNITVIERPLRVTALVSVLRSALRARRRQCELRAMLRALHEADRRKNEFLATLAHELRNPLAPMSNALTLVSRSDVSAERAEELAALMRRQLDHLVHLVDDLMQISRITRGKVELRSEAVALDLPLTDALELSSAIIEDAGHRLSVQWPSIAPVVWGDRVRLAQVFANLLTNAAKYTRRGGAIGVALRVQGREAVLEVTDNGDGLAPEMLAPIFEMFVQASASGRVASGGLGIGLTLVKSLVEMHGGRVRASSPGLGLGSTFTVWLPVMQARAAGDPYRSSPVAEVQANPPDDASDLSGLTVLVVDDNRDAANSLAELLRYCGAEALVAYDASEALQHAPPADLDAAILDIGMPGTDGCALARMLREHPATGALTLIALTGWGHPADHARIMAADFQHHLLKPADFAEIARILGPLPRRGRASSEERAAGEAARRATGGS